MNKFTCKNEECIADHEEHDEDVRLILYIEEGSYTEYRVNSNGSLEYKDADGTGQEIYLYCPICDQKYEFNIDYFEISKQHVLPFDKRDLEDIDIIKVK